MGDLSVTGLKRGRIGAPVMGSYRWRMLVGAKGAKQLLYFSYQLAFF